MSFKDTISRIFRRKDEVQPDKEVVNTSNNWYLDQYESTLVQRNIFFVVAVVATVALAGSTMVIRYVKNTKSIEPFVIEIEERTGVPTVVDPVTIEAYSANDAVVRYFVMKYIRAREEYFPALYRYNFDTVVRVLSSESVYYSDYKPKFSVGNPQSPVNALGMGGARVVLLKSIIFPAPETAQIRFTLQTSGGSGAGSADKIVFLQYEFANINMNEDERLINPLGFRIVNYKIEDERL